MADETLTPHQAKVIVLKLMVQNLESLDKIIWNCDDTLTDADKRVVVKVLHNEIETVKNSLRFAERQLPLRERI